MNARQPALEVIYNGKDITTDLSEHLVRFTYEGAAKGEADSIDIAVQDSTEIWTDYWLPSKGDTISVRIGYVGQMVSLGNFYVDEITSEGPPSMVTIRGIAAGFGKAMRTKTSFAHENKTLAQIVGVVAQKNSLTVQGTIANILVERATQYDETDLAFLKRLGKKYGYIFSVRGSNLVFENQLTVETSATNLTFDRSEIAQWSLTDKVSESYSRAKVKYTNPATDELIEAEADAGVEDVSADELQIKARAENKGQADTIAKAAIYVAKTLRLTGSITLEGNPYIMEGSSIRLTGLGALSGVYSILKVRHNIDGSGYVCTAEVKRLASISREFWKPKPQA